MRSSCSLWACDGIGELRAETSARVMDVRGIDLEQGADFRALASARWSWPSVDVEQDDGMGAGHRHDAPDPLRRFRDWRRFVLYCIEV